MRYPVALHERLYVLFIAPLLTVIVIAALVSFVPPSASAGAVTLSLMLGATLATLLRIGTAYVIAAVVAIPLALLVERNRTFEALLLPVFDVFESIPNLAIFPALLIFFLQFNFLDGAAITILFLNMLWNIVFALVGGLQVIPKDVTYAARMFGLNGVSYVRRLVLPAVFPQFVTGSILAVASGWNIIIVAEAVHAYLPAGTNAQDLFGIGSLLVTTSAAGDKQSYILAFIVMVGVIALFNFFVWQKLLHYSQRFRFE